ncbi:MAG: AAA family ATPase, partial [Anaerolineales bacterium]
MQLTRLSLTNFRNFARMDAFVPDGTILIVGDNAQGKTSILEAIYFLATLSSFHASSDREMVNLIAGQEKLAVARIIGEFKKGNTSHRLEVRIIQEKNGLGSGRVRKEVLLDGVKKRAREAIGAFNAVLFLPQMMQVIEGPPDERRRYLDMAISQVVPQAASALLEYGKVVSQRNALLKQLVETPAFDPMPAPQNQPALLYSPPDRSQLTQEKIETDFLQALKDNRRMEIARGVTTIGPHRDDLSFISNGIDMGTYGSRGQVRTAMMTMKLAEMHWMQEKTGYWPVLLLDEVLAELDEHRRADLMGRVSQSKQSLLTTTDVHLFDPQRVAEWQQWQIHAGTLTED